uniref:CUB domain-containing protein n=1 Tax=Strigamia maritima TaxID=126957 RepID=T1JI54_STRMM
MATAMGLIVFLLLLSRLFFQYARAVNPGCECIVFDGSHGRNEGVFISPNFPTPYEDNINCLLYTFVGHPDEIIQLTFDDFDLHRIDNMDCVFGDFVKLFLHLHEAKVNEYTRWNGILCGSLADIERTHFSSNSTLIFEFHSDWRHSNHTGFKGTYKFLSRKFFLIDGELISGTECDYQFLSGNHSQSRGRFYSPRYPSNYPKYSRCSYRFLGQFGERVRVVFDKVSLRQGDYSCLYSPDDIVVHDGKDAASPVISQLCNSNTMVRVVSTGPELYIEFSSRGHDPGQGFEARFIFDDEKALTTFEDDVVDIPSTEPDKSSDDKREEEKEVVTTSRMESAVECNERITSDQSKNSTIMSPNFPRPYPANIRCTYNFTGHGKERVQIIFTDFDLHMGPDEISPDCEHVDVVMIFVYINGKTERVDNFCGHKIPPQLMSNGPSLTIEFHAMSIGLEKGFRAIYRFVKNFGITSGRQDTQSVCGFIYNSSEALNGTFTSPNYPGYYPRDIECHYFFYGRHSEKVRITFPYFDVEGVTPCTSITASDYVEFSNFKTVDRKIPRHCGMKKPNVITSEGDYFRVTFKSNDKFDGTGFEAYYQFNSNEGD